MIDRYLLRYFLAVVDRGTFSRAAAQVNVAQPTLSIGIAKLERLLGTPLFQRNSQRVHLTGAGARLVVHAGGSRARSTSPRPPLARSTPPAPSGWACSPPFRPPR